MSLDTPSLQAYAAHCGGAAAVKGVIMHELGHVLGLAIRTRTVS